jgi:hypothetical protein
MVSAKVTGAFSGEHLPPQKLQALLPANIGPCKSCRPLCWPNIRLCKVADDAVGAAFDTNFGIGEAIWRKAWVELQVSFCGLRFPANSLRFAVMNSPKRRKGSKASQYEDMMADLPPGTQISPGPDGGMMIFIPHSGGFSPEVPEYRGPWAKIRKEIFEFEVLAGRDGETIIPRAKTPPEGMDARCDQWIREFYQDKNRWKRSVPKEIAPWLVARSMMAGMFVAMDDDHGVRPEPLKLEEHMCRLLIDFWNEVGRNYWHGIHPDASAHPE